MYPPGSRPESQTGRIRLDPDRGPDLDVYALRSLRISSMLFTLDELGFHPGSDVVPVNGLTFWATIKQEQKYGRMDERKEQTDR